MHNISFYFCSGFDRSLLPARQRIEQSGIAQRTQSGYSNRPSMRDATQDLGNLQMLNFMSDEQVISKCSK